MFIASIWSNNYATNKAHLLKFWLDFSAIFDSSRSVRFKKLDLSNIEVLLELTIEVLFNVFLFVFKGCFDLTP